MSQDYFSPDGGASLKLENRIRNLAWTVSGDYTLKIEPDVEAFLRSPNIALYDAVKQGAFAKFFDRDSFYLYILKKIYYGADSGSLNRTSRLVIDGAAIPRLMEERTGVSHLRKKAYADLFEYEFHTLTASLIGNLQYVYQYAALHGEDQAHVSPRLQDSYRRLTSLADGADTMDVIRATDAIYNALCDSSFDKRGITLEQILAVTPEELREFDWQDYLNDELREELARSQAASEVMDASAGGGVGASDQISDRVVYTDNLYLEKRRVFVEKNFGRSFLTPAEQERLNRAICNGVHRDCRVYMTEGILAIPVEQNYQYKMSSLQTRKNKQAYHRDHRTIKRNISILTDALRRTLTLRSDIYYSSSDHGTLQPALVWKAGRIAQPNLFRKETRGDDSRFVVDVLIDGSGSQRSRQSQVALQGYILSNALYAVQIPHRVMSYCTFWDHTVLHRFRDYDDPASAAENIFRYNSMSSNRDGLAIRAAADGLLRRSEENKILIVLSDGRPSDLVVNQDGQSARPYQGEFAVRDTAMEVRHLRSLGVSVLGVFAGREEDLPAEKMIFGKDFAYIRTIENFSNVVGRYLQMQLDDF